MKKFLLFAVVMLASVASFAAADPCSTAPKIKVAISQTANAKLITGVAGSKIYVCHFHIVTTLANNVAIVEGTGATCGTGTAGIAGGTTAATGWNLAANAIMNLGNGMAGVLQADAAAGDDVCLLQSAATQVSGTIIYVRTVTN